MHWKTCLTLFVVLFNLSPPLTFYLWYFQIQLSYVIFSSWTWPPPTPNLLPSSIWENNGPQTINHKWLCMCVYTQTEWATTLKVVPQYQTANRTEILIISALETPSARMRRWLNLSELSCYFPKWNAPNWKLNIPSPTLKFWDPLILFSVPLCLHIWESCLGKSQSNSLI